MATVGAPLHSNRCINLPLAALIQQSLLCRCSSAETQILKALNDSDVGSADFNPIILAEYYLLGQGGSLNAIAKNATGVDFNAVMSTVADTVQKAITVSLLHLWWPKLIFCCEGTFTARCWHPSQLAPLCAVFTAGTYTYLASSPVLA